MLTDAVFAPEGIDILPYDKAANPIPTNISPNANFTGPEGFHTFSQSLLKEEAKVTIKKEFRI
ncbi:Uncharacterised protein [Sphingobacterium spiritivorum]|uniref:Uncharacterized protein n=1 Tax=Sphingobacterium spiritivorum TaxID=258 RepID=A0A380CV77_SPHSI|nr:Uncharacterised protein [Sphingobacterium spiritivorum]